MDGAYVIKLDKYADVWTYWIVLYVKNIEIIYFDSFVVKHVPKEIINLFDIKTKEKKKKHIWNTSKQFNSVCILLHWIHWFYACR